MAFTDLHEHLAEMFGYESPDLYVEERKNQAMGFNTYMKRDTRKARAARGPETCRMVQARAALARKRASAPKKTKKAKAPDLIWIRGPRGKRYALPR